MSKPRASIVIPHHEPDYEASELLRRTLESVGANTPPPYEIIVVDGGSTAGMRQWLAGWSKDGTRANAVMLADNLGFTKHVNVGLHLAEGDCIVLLNNDIEVSPGWLEAMERALAEDPLVGIVGCQIRDMVDRQQIVFGGAVAPAKHKLGFADKGDWQERTYDDDYLTFCCVMLRRKMVAEIGPLDEQFIIHCSDSDYCYRAREAGWKLCYEPKAIIYHEQEGTLRYMRGSPQIEAVLRQDQQRFRAKWQGHLRSLGRLYEFPWPGAAAIFPNTGDSLGAPGAPGESSPSPSANMSG